MCCTTITCYINENHTIDCYKTHERSEYITTVNNLDDLIEYKVKNNIHRIYLLLNKMWMYEDGVWKMFVNKQWKVV